MKYGSMDNNTALDDICKNCGGRRGLHNAMNQRCPKDINSNADNTEYRNTVFALPKPDPASPSLLEALKKIADKIPTNDDYHSWQVIMDIEVIARDAIRLYEYDTLALHSSGREGEGQEDIDNFAIAFHIWATYDPQAKAYQEAGISAGNLLRKYKDRPYINTDTSKQ